MHMEVFDKKGTITAANASTINDGAACLLMMSENKASELGFKPLARIISQASAAQDPKWFTTAPIEAIKKVLMKVDLTVDDIDLWEINEAFAPVVMAVVDDYNLDYDDDKNKINFSDIISRVEKKSSNSKIAKKLRGRNILVTGGGGSIGSEICYKLLTFKPSNVLAYDNSEFALYNLQKNHPKKILPVLGDVNDFEYINYIVKKYKINYIFHAAAYKHVNFLEKNVIQAVKNNIFGTYNVLKLCNKHKIKLTIVSTDKAAKPKSVLGYSKRISEIIAQKYQGIRSNVSIVRFGNVFASRGSAIPNFVDQILKEKKITVSDESVKRYFMSINEAANLVIRSILLTKNKQGILLLKMGRQLKILDIIKRIAKLLNKKEYFKKSNIEFIGLKKGEKLKESLSYSKKLIQTSIQEIIMVKEPIYKNNKIENLIQNILDNKYNDKKLIIIMKKFLKNEI